MDKIYKMVPNVTKEEILQKCEYKDDLDCNIIKCKDFIGMVNSYCIMDYDGFGYIAIDGKVVKDTILWISSKAVFFIDRFIIPFDILYKILGDRIGFVWYNK